MNEKNKKDIIQLTKGVNLIAPASLQWEIGNAFSAMFKRNRLQLDDAIIALKYYKDIPIRFIDVDLDDSLEIANKHKIYAYDAYFISAAKNLNVPLFSLDKQLLKIAVKEGLKIIEVLS